MTHRDIFEDEGCQLVFLKMRIVEIDLMYVLDKYFKTAYRIVVLVSGIKVVLTDSSRGLSQKIREIFAKNLRNIREIFVKYSRNIREIFAKN